MRRQSAFRHGQQGLSLIGMIFLSIIVVMLALLGMKIAPAIGEYFTILKDARAVATSSDVTTVADVRDSFMKRAQVDNIESITPSALDITKEGSQIVVSFAYTRKIPLFGPVSLVIDFQGSSAPGGK